MYVCMMPVGPYYATGFKPISLWADTEHVRAWPGGTGDAKVKNLYRIIAIAAYSAVLSWHKLHESCFLVIVINCVCVTATHRLEQTMQ
jgi:branched-subunit amino acid aminotransferase/4-amino-4-deoxychorismate lyase